MVGHDLPGEGEDNVAGEGGEDELAGGCGGEGCGRASAEAPGLSEEEEEESVLGLRGCGLYGCRLDGRGLYGYQQQAHQQGSGYDLLHHGRNICALVVKGL